MAELYKSIVYVSKQGLSKTLIQFAKNIEDHTIAHFIPYFAFFFILQSILYREIPQIRDFILWPNCQSTLFLFLNKVFQRLSFKS